MKKLIATLALAAGVGWTGLAAAATATGTLTVQATVADACSLADGALAFGNVDPNAGVTSAVRANIAVTCTLGASFTVGLGDGQNLAAGSRRMRRGATADYLKYELFRELLLTSRFGDSGASDRVAGTGAGNSSTSIVVYGTMPSGQSVAGGSYADSVQITVYY